MRISSFCGGFNLYEIMISITSMGIISGLITVSVLPLIDQILLILQINSKTHSDRQSGWRLQNAGPTELILIQDF